jgi:hypothetical protein
MATSDVAGCNWVLYCDTLLSHTFRDALPQEMFDDYPTVGFDVKCLMTDSVTNQWIVFYQICLIYQKILLQLLSCCLQ